MATSVSTAAQLNTIATKLGIIEQAITDYLNSPAAATLRPGQRTALAAQRDAIGDDVGDIASVAAAIALADAASAAASLNAVTNQIKADIVHLANVQKVINLAGSALSLAASILTTPIDPGAIASAIPGVISSVSAIVNPPAAPGA